MLMRNELVGMWRRMAALVIDGIMLILASIPLSLIIREMTLSQVAIWLLLVGIMIIYSTVFITRRGQTPGKVMMMLRVISEKGGAVTQRQALIRSAVKWVPVFSVFILLAAVSAPPPNPQDYLRPDGGLVAQDPEAALPGIIIAGAGLLLAVVLLILTRLHPDRRSLHDRIAGTFLIRLNL